MFFTIINITLIINITVSTLLLKAIIFIPRRKGDKILVILKDRGHDDKEACIVSKCFAMNCVAVYNLPA